MHMRCLSFFEYTQQWADYLKDGPVANAGLAKMQTYGPWDTRKRRDMEGFAAIIVVMLLAA